MNMLATIVPKSDQLNADDLIAGPLTIKVAKVTVDPTSEQPCSIYYESDPNKPYKACKSMRRVLVKVWGPDANAYAGRSMTLYRDDGVRFGGMEVGGIRISHVSHIDKPVTMALTATRANRKPFTVEPLAMARDAAPKRTLGAYLAEKLGGCGSEQAIDELVGTDPVIMQNVQKPAVQEAISQARARFATVETPAADDLPDDDGSDFPGDAILREQRETAHGETA